MIQNASCSTPLLNYKWLILCGLSLSIGWGIRGNFGHEYGAMMPGVLCAIAAVLLSGREDWWRRVSFFALFGALGWSFGGSMSYMQVLSYTHSGHWPTQIYGYICFFIIGFLWAALGGAGTALPAVLDRKRIEQIFAPMTAVFIAWFLQDLIVPWIEQLENTQRRHESILYWFDTDWIAALLAIAAVLLLAAFRGRLCWGSRLILHMAIGWWVMFLVVVFFAGFLHDHLGIPYTNFRMTPPRGDNWAGCVGMTAGLLIFFIRERLYPLAYATLVSGFFGGFAFITAVCLKLIEIKTGWDTNWHSILEQTTGFLNGIGIAVTMGYFAPRLPRVQDEEPCLRWTELYALCFVLLLVPYLNSVKIAPEWIDKKAVPEILYGLPLNDWFHIGYGLVVFAFLFLLAWHHKEKIPLIPEDLLSKGQLLYVVFLWVCVTYNLIRIIPLLADQRLVTEGVIHVNAVIATVLILIWPRKRAVPENSASPVWPAMLGSVTARGLIAAAISITLYFGVTRVFWGDQHAGYSALNTRFGENATALQKPEKGKNHP